jgi:hypothetical protein
LVGVACRIAQVLAVVAVAVVPEQFEAMREGSAADLRALLVLPNPLVLLVLEERPRTG